VNSVHHPHRRRKGDAFMSLQTPRPNGVQRTTPNGRQRGSPTPTRPPIQVGRFGTYATWFPRAEFPSTDHLACADSAGTC
jgi:hypothetical protein